MERELRLFDVVALIADVPEERLRRGQVGTIVEVVGAGVYEVEFSDDHGRTYASTAIRREQLLLLHHEPASAP